MIRAKILDAVHEYPEVFHNNLIIEITLDFEGDSFVKLYFG
jgi:hypothetical protein